MFEVYILTPCASTTCVATFSRTLTSLSLAVVRDYGLNIVTTRPKSKRCKGLHSESVLVVSPCLVSSTRCHPKHGLVQEPDGEHGPDVQAPARVQAVPAEDEVG